MVGTTFKMLQLFKSIYTNAKMIEKVVASLSQPFDIGRDVLEGGVDSPILFNIDLETVFREAS